LASSLRPEEGSSTLLQNVGKHLEDYVASSQKIIIIVTVVRVSDSMYCVLKMEPAHCSRTLVSI
jgi:hypothetical protein